MMDEPSWSLGTAALRGAASWSHVFLPEELWGEYARAAQDARSPSEVYIAIAISLGVEGATDAFEHMYFHVIDRALERVGASATEVEHLKDMLRNRLFTVKNGTRPLITALAGRGDMSVQLRLTVLRAFVDMRVRRGEAVVADRGGLLPLLDELPEFERLAMRLCVLHGLSLDDIAARLRSTRTVARHRLMRARQMLEAAALDDISRDILDVLVDASLGE